MPPGRSGSRGYLELAALERLKDFLEGPPILKPIFDPARLLDGLRRPALGPARRPKVTKAGSGSNPRSRQRLMVLW